MRILHVCPALDPAWAYGQTPQRVARLARAQAALGHNVVVLTTDALAPHERLRSGRSQINDVEVIRVRNLRGGVRTWLGLSTPLRMAAHFRSVVDEAALDIVHGHELRTVENLIAVRAIPRAVPLVVSLHETTRGTGHEPIHRLWDALVGDRVLARIDTAITASPEEAVEFRALCDARGRALCDDQLMVLPHGVERTAPAATTSRADARRRFSLNDGPVVLFAERPVDPQDIELLLSAFLEIADSLPHVQLLVVGSNRGAIGAARTRVRSHSAEARVHFAGHLTAGDRDVAFAAADLLALPLVGEASLTARVESLAVGVPVIADRRARLDAVDAHETGWTVEGPRAWADALRAALTDQSSLDAKRERAETLARSFAWPEVAADVIRVYERVRARVAARRPPGAPAAA